MGVFTDPLFEDLGVSFISKLFSIGSDFAFLVLASLDGSSIGWNGSAES